MKNNLNKKELAEIRYRYVKHYDKWKRMFKGCSTNIKRYEEGILYIEFSNSKKFIDTNYENAVLEAINWKYFNKELKDAIAFVVVCKDTNVQPGFSLGSNEINDTNLLKSKIQSIKVNKDSYYKIETIYSGVFSEEMIDYKDNGNGAYSVGYKKPIKNNYEKQ